MDKTCPYQVFCLYLLVLQMYIVSISTFLVDFTRWLILYNSCSADVSVSGTSASLLHFLRALYHSSPILRSSNLKFSCSSSDPESFVDLAFKCNLFQNLFYCIVHESIKLFALGWDLLGALEPYATCSAVTIGQPSQLHGFLLCLHDFTQVHVIYRSIQRTNR